MNREKINARISLGREMGTMKFAILLGLICECLFWVTSDSLQNSKKRFANGKVGKIVEIKVNNKIIKLEETCCIDYYYIFYLSM